jgi:hypothetical protein
MLRFAVKPELPMAIAIELEALAGMRDALFFHSVVNSRETPAQSSSLLSLNRKPVPARLIAITIAPPFPGQSGYPCHICQWPASLAFCYHSHDEK